MKLHQLKYLCGGSAALTPLTTFAIAATLMTTAALLPTQSVRAESAQAIEEVVVTARKRQETLQEVPVVVNVLTEETLNTQRIEGVKDIGTIVPGMVTSQTISGTSGVIYLRGVGTGASNPAFDQAVSINLDGVGIASTSLMNAGMFDLRQIEVLRGPQALFFGKNSPGGVVAIHTNDPGDEFEFELSGMYETEAEESTVRGIISGPITETLGGRISFGWSDAENNLIDAINGDVFEPGPAGPVQTAFAYGDTSLETQYAMGTLNWEPTDSFSGKFKYAYLEDELEGLPYTGIQKSWCGLGAPQELYPVAGVDNCKVDNKNVIGGANPALIAALDGGRFAGSEQFIRNEVDFSSLELNYVTDNGLNFTSVSGYVKTEERRVADAAFQQASGLSVTNGTEIEQFSQELRLVTEFDGAVNFTIGGFYETKEIDRDTDVFLGSNFAGLPTAVFGVFPIALGRQISAQEGTSYSVFGQVDWEINDQWTLAVGGRMSFEEKEADIRAIAGGFDVAVPLLDDEEDWDNFSPELTLSYQFTDDIMFFASYRTGFKSGGYDLSYKPTTHLTTALTPGASFDALYEEETVDGFEAGMKSTLLDGSLRLNVTAYSFTYEDLQLSKFAADSSGALSFRVINAAEASLEGLEIETLWVTPVDGLTLSANVAIANSEYDDYIADCFTGQTIALGCTVNPDPVTGNFRGADMEGESLPFASDLSMNLGVNYERAISSNWVLALNVNGSFKDDYNPVSEFVPDEAQQDSYWWVNASVSLYSADDKWEFYVRGVNLTDEYYRVSASGAPLTGNGATTGTADPSGLPDLIAFVSGGRQISLGFTFRM